MSTAIDTAPGQPGQQGQQGQHGQSVIEGKGLSFWTLTRVELRKQVDTRAGRGLLIAILVITALVMALVMWFSRHQGASFSSLMAATATPQGMLLPILGIITATNEWSQRTALVTFTQEPRRMRVIAAKSVSALLLGTVAFVLSLGLAALAHLVSANLAHVPTHFDMSAGLIARTWLVDLVGVLQGVAFGLALLSVPMAVIAFFVLPMVWAIFVNSIAALRRAAAWVDTVSAGAPLGSEGVVTGSQWSHWAVANLLWVGIPLVIGVWRVLRREVK